MKWKDNRRQTLNLKGDSKSKSVLNMKQLLIGFLIALSGVILLQLAPAEAGLLDSSCSHSNKTHNYFYGKSSYRDRILYHDHLKYKSKWMQVTSVDIDYPPKGTTPLGTISYIEILDQRTDGTGGCVYLRNGGVGNNYVTLHIKSQRNHGMEFFIDIYGH